MKTLLRVAYFLAIRWGPFAVASLLLWCLTVWAAVTVGDWWAR